MWTPWRSKARNSGEGLARVFPAANRMGMDGLANLQVAGGSHDAFGRVEFETGRIPFQSHEINQPGACLSRSPTMPS